VDQVSLYVMERGQIDAAFALDGDFAGSGVEILPAG
jgi:hypothetical protein